MLLDLPISREYFLGLFRSRRLAPRIGARSRYLDVVCSMVGNGAGYSLLNVPPSSGRAADGSRLATVRLAGSHRALRLGLLQVSAGRRTRAAAAFAPIAGPRCPPPVQPTQRLPSAAYWTIIPSVIHSTGARSSVSGSEDGAT